MHHVVVQISYIHCSEAALCCMVVSYPCSAVFTQVEGRWKSLAKARRSILGSLFYKKKKRSGPLVPVVNDAFLGQARWWRSPGPDWEQTPSSILFGERGAARIHTAERSKQRDCRSDSAFQTAATFLCSTHLSLIPLWSRPVSMLQLLTQDLLLLDQLCTISV